MPVIYVGGKPYSISEDEFDAGKYPAEAHLAVLAGDGTVGTMSLDNVRPQEARRMLAEGQGEIASEQLVKDHIDEYRKEKALEDEFSGVIPGAKAVALGAAQGLTFGGVGALLDMTGMVSREYQDELAKRQKAAYIAGEIGGVLLPGVGLAAKGVGAAAKGIGLAAKAASYAPKLIHAATYAKIAPKGAGVTRKIAGAAAEGAAYSTARTVGDLVRDREDFEIESAAAHIVNSAISGVMIGGGLQGIGSAAAKSADWVSQSRVPVFSWVVDKIAQLSSAIQGRMLPSSEIGAARQATEDIAAAGGVKSFQKGLQDEVKSAREAARQAKIGMSDESVRLSQKAADENVVFNHKIAQERSDIGKAAKEASRQSSRRQKAAVERARQEQAAVTDRYDGLEAELKEINKPFSRVKDGKATTVDKYVDTVGKEQDAVALVNLLQGELDSSWQAAVNSGVGKVSREVINKVKGLSKALHDIKSGGKTTKKIFSDIDDVIKDFEKTYPRKVMSGLSAADQRAVSTIREKFIENAKSGLDDASIFGTMGSKNKEAREAWAEYYRVEDSFRNATGKSKITPKIVAAAVRSNSHAEAVTTLLMAKKDLARKIANIFPEKNTQAVLSAINKRTDDVIGHLKGAIGARETNKLLLQEKVQLQDRIKLMTEQERNAILDKKVQSMLERNAAVAQRKLDKMAKAESIRGEFAAKVDAVKSKQDFAQKITGQEYDDVITAGGRIAAKKMADWALGPVAKLAGFVSSPYAIYRAGMATSNGIKKIAESVDKVVGRGGKTLQATTALSDRTGDDYISWARKMLDYPEAIDIHVRDQISDAELAGKVSLKVKSILGKIANYDSGRKQYLVNQITGETKKMSQTDRQKALKFVRVMTDPYGELTGADAKSMQHLMSEYPAILEIFKSAMMQTLPETTKFGSKQQMTVSRLSGQVATEMADPTVIMDFQSQMAPRDPQQPQEQLAEGRRVNDAAARRISSSNQLGMTIGDKIMSGAYV